VNDLEVLHIKQGYFEESPGLQI